MKVGVIGLGTMGLGAAMSIAKAGHECWGCDLREAPRAELEKVGGHGVGSAAELPEGLEALVLFVVNAAQVEEVLFGQKGCIDRLAPGTLVICSVTIAPTIARVLAKKLAGHGLLMLDAPVSGGFKAAQAGTMTVMASGSPEAFAKAEPVLAAFGEKIWRLGDACGVGSTVKMVNQLLAGVHIAAAGEAMALGIRAGADPQTLYDVITTSAGNSWMFQNRVPHILAGDDTPLSAVNIFVKDLGIVLDQARTLTFPLPLAAAAHQLFLAAAAHGDGPKDDAFVIRFWEALAGIGLPAKKD